MGELLDRAFQRELLHDLQALYPQPADIQRSYGTQPDNRLLVNLAYLDEHGMVDFKWNKFISGDIQMHSAKITARGMDFIANDGGLSAILGVVTVRLHEDTIRALLIEKVASSEADETIKSRLIDKLKDLPSDALATVTTAALEAGLGQMPDVIGWLQTLIGRS
jgi:hypothetical protein